MGDDSTRSESRCGPGGTETRCLEKGVTLETRWSDQGGEHIRIISAGSVVDKRFEHARFALLDTVPKGDEVDGHVVLFELLRELDHLPFVRT